MTEAPKLEPCKHSLDRRNCSACLDAQAAADEAHPGFVVTCRKCGSTVVSVRSDTGYSPQSGGWGGVQLRCEDCGAENEIWGMP